MKTTRIISAMALCGFLCLSDVFAQNAANFSDTKGNWAESMISEAVSKGMIHGYSDGTFRPNAQISAIEAYAIAFRTSGAVDDARAKADWDGWKHWYLQHYEMNGYETNTLHPETDADDDAYSREKALYVLLKAKGIDFWSGTEGIFAKAGESTGFPDVSPDASYALYAKYAKDQGIVNGYSNGDFGFGNNVTRAEFVKMALGIFGRSDLASAESYIIGLQSVSRLAEKPKNGSEFLTYPQNIHIKGQSFTDSTKVPGEGKHIYNGHWYYIQSDEYYANMNTNETPIQTAWSLWNSRTIYHTTADGWKFIYKEGFSSSKSWDYQRIIDIIRYNDNFYFGDINPLRATLKVFGDVKSIQEFNLAYKQVTTTYWNYVDTNNFVKQLSLWNKADYTFTLNNIMSSLGLIF